VKAARELGISRCYLHRLLNRLEIDDVALGEVALPEDYEETPEPAPGLGILVRGEGLAFRPRVA
jgi:hypothetical protein